MITVSLKDVSIVTFLGIYPEERKVPNHIICDLDVHFEVAAGGGIGATVDYTILHALLKQKLSAGGGLLEELIADIAGNVKERFPFIKGLRITVRKVHPPIEGFQGSVAVTLEKNYAS
jgi:dihydroneopterin aldolase